VTGDQTLQVIAAIMMLTLVGSSLVSRRLPIGQVARMVAGWLLIFAAVLVGYSYRFELNAVVQRVAGDLLGERGQTVGGTLRVPMAPDGHFWVRARINGHEQRFLIDSGATTTALSTDAAEAADLNVERGGLPIVINTANGAAHAYPPAERRPDRRQGHGRGRGGGVRRHERARHEFPVVAGQLARGEGHPHSGAAQTG
jgi:aspartyl protease family protein